MKLTRPGFYPIIIFSVFIAFQACKAKKAVTTTAAPSETAAPPTTTAGLANQQKMPAATTTSPASAANTTDKPDYSFNNIQFEFDSSILKTDSYGFLDKAVAAMKADASVKFALNGYASAEGTDEHNMQLSVERANAVKLYLVNSGISTSRLTAKGFGEANPVADNTTEAGKIINRRVEIRIK